MTFGLFGINSGPCGSPKCAAAVARAAEQAGFESLWTGEHVILPDPQVPPSPVPAGARGHAAPLRLGRWEEGKCSNGDMLESDDEIGRRRALVFHPEVARVGRVGPGYRMW